MLFASLSVAFPCVSLSCCFALNGSGEQCDARLFLEACAHKKVLEKRNLAQKYVRVFFCSFRCCRGTSWNRIWLCALCFVCLCPSISLRGWGG